MVRSATIRPPTEGTGGGHEGSDGRLNLRPGDLVQVRSEAEILSTLDESISLQALPFMPEMSGYCGGDFRVLRKVDKVIIEGRSGLRRMRNAVILDGATCDGSAHEGCQYSCLLLWRQEWLKRPDDATISGNRQANPVWPAIKTRAGNEPFTCQATALFAASSPLPFWNIDQYICDIREGVFNPRVLARTWFILTYNKIRCRLGLKKRYLFHGHHKTTPTMSLNLQPGELVRVKTRQEIAETLDSRGRNRGLGFTQEMLGYCGKTYRVLRRMDSMIVESTGRMQQLTDTVLLDGALCKGEAHFNCHRKCRSLWKEIWLERV